MVFPRQKSRAPRPKTGCRSSNNRPIPLRFQQGLERVILQFRLRSREVPNTQLVHHAGPNLRDIELSGRLKEHRVGVDELNFLEVRNNVRRLRDVHPIDVERHPFAVERCRHVVPRVFVECTWNGHVERRARHNGPTSSDQQPKAGIPHAKQSVGFTDVPNDAVLDAGLGIVPVFDGELVALFESERVVPVTKQVPGHGRVDGGSQARDRAAVTKSFRQRHQVHRAEGNRGKCVRQSRKVRGSPFASGRAESHAVVAGVFTCQIESKRIVDRIKNPILRAAVRQRDGRGDDRIDGRPCIRKLDDDL